MNPELRCLSIVVLLMALTGCGSDSLQSEQVEKQHPEKVEDEQPRVAVDNPPDRKVTNLPERVEDDEPAHLGEEIINAIENSGGAGTKA